MIVGRKIKLHPNINQEQLLKQFTGTSRFAYNWALNKQQLNYNNGKPFIQDGELRKEFTQFKKEQGTKWLYDISCDVPKQAIKDACNAYKRFFKKQAKYPRFKSKKDKQSFYQDVFKIKFMNGKVYISSIGWIDIAENVNETKVQNPRVSYDGVGWYISFGIEQEKSLLNKPTTEPIGIDLGIKDLAIVSNAKVYKNINKTKKIKKLKKRLKRQQRKASKLYEKIKRKEIVAKSKNLMKLECQIRKTYKKMTDIRTNHIHQMTSELVKAKPEYIVIETLNISGMMKNRHLSKVIQEQNLYEVIRQLKYKCDWYDVELIEADRWYPSSKTCSKCGHVHKGLKLKDRIYHCPSCSLVIDRDLNASINLREYKNIHKAA